MKSSFLIFLLTAFSALTSHAETYTQYACHDQETGDFVAELGVQPDCSALPLGCAYVRYGGHQTAIGSYDMQTGPCPSRLCGSFHLYLQARSTNPSVKWPVEEVMIDIEGSEPGLASGEIIFQSSNEKAARRFNVLCESLASPASQNCLPPRICGPGVCCHSPPQGL